jgi:hypothetical protein
MPLIGETIVMRDLPLPALLQRLLALQQRGERAGVRSSGIFRRRHLGLPLTLALFPQAGRGDPVGVCREGVP